MENVVFNSVRCLFFVVYLIYRMSNLSKAKVLMMHYDVLWGKQPAAVVLL